MLSRKGISSFAKITNMDSQYHLAIVDDTTSQVTVVNSSAIASTYSVDLEVTGNAIFLKETLL